MKKSFTVSSIALVVASTLFSCTQDTSIKTITSAPQEIKKALTAKDADVFLAKIEQEFIQLNQEVNQVEWVYNNFITEDTAALSARVNQKATEAGVKSAIEAAQFDHVNVSPDQRRKLNTLKQSLVMPAPQDPAKSAELAQLGSNLNGMYGKGTFTNKAGQTLSLGEMTSTMAHSRNYDELLELWKGWRTISPKMKPLFMKQTELANEGAKSLGYKDLGVMWRSKYDMPADDFAKELDRLWGQVKPLYDDLHCYVRAELGKK